MRLQVKLIANLEVDLAQYLEEDEVLDGTPEAADPDNECDVFTETDLIERVRDQIDDGSFAMDDVMEQAGDYTVTVEPSALAELTNDWTARVMPSEVAFVKSIVDQIPEVFGARERFYEVLQKLAGAQ